MFRFISTILAMLLEALPKTKRQMNFVKQREIEKYLLDEHFIKIINTKADENKKKGEDETEIKNQTEICL